MVKNLVFLCVFAKGRIGGALGVSVVSLASFWGHFGELWGSLWGALGIHLGVHVDLLGIPYDTLRCLLHLGGYRACPKGGEAPVGQGRLGNTCDISVVAGDILGYPLWGPWGGTAKM